MSVITGRPKPLLVPYLAVTDNTYTIGVDLGIIKATPTANATWTLPALSLLKNGGFLWIDNQSNFLITLSTPGSDLINGGDTYECGNQTFTTLYTGTSWGASGYNIPPVDGGTNVRLGSLALSSNISGDNNTAIGYGALQDNTTGNNNTSTGYLAGESNISASSNTFYGYMAGNATSIGGTNTLIGANSAALNISGIGNTALGQGTFTALNSGSNNIAIGNGAGGILTTGSSNIYLGASAATTGEALAIRLGNLAVHTRTYMVGNPVATESNPVAAGATLTGAALFGGIFQGNANITTDTGTNIDTAFNGINTGNTIKCLVTNASGGAITITGGVGVTINQTISIANNDSRVIYCRKTGVATYTVY